MQQGLRLLIIEDEPPAARQLERLLEKQSILGKYDIVAVLDTVRETVRYLETANPYPDLIFMDIQIADGLSFDIFEQIRVQCPVIFTTAYHEFALQAFKVSAVDYLLKPVEPSDLDAALAKFKKQLQVPDYTVLMNLLQQKPYKTRFLVKTGSTMSFLQEEDIAFFSSSDGLTEAINTQGKRFFVENTLSELETLLNPSRFFRINRSMILRAEAISKIHQHFNGRLRLDVLPRSEEEVFVSRERVAEFKTWLGG